MMYTPKELASDIAESRRMRERKRVKIRQYVRGRPRGRPIRHSGTYYTRPVLVTDRLMLKIRQNRLPGEPLGSVLERLVGLAEQKKLQAQLESYNPFVRPILSDDNNFKTVWKELDRK